MPSSRRVSASTRRLCLFCLALLLCACADSTDAIYAKGIHAYSRGEYREAEPWIRQAATEGHRDGQAVLGVMYLYGRGVPVDGQQAEHWLLLAAEAGHVDAQSILGMMYATGAGVAIDRSKAHKWLSLAAQEGDKHATETLRLYFGAEGVASD